MDASRAIDPPRSGYTQPAASTERCVIKQSTETIAGSQVAAKKEGRKEDGFRKKKKVKKNLTSPGDPRVQNALIFSQGPVPFITGLHNDHTQTLPTELPRNIIVSSIMITSC